MRVAMLQVASPDDEALADRRARVDRMVRSEARLDEADLLVLPELWGVGAFNYRGFTAAAEPLDGPTQALARAWASRHGLWVHAGSFVEEAPDGRRFNTVLILRPDGTLAATYRKVHLFGTHEARQLAAGDELGLVHIDGLTAGLATCYDLRFPELFRSTLDAGATLTLLASAWPDARIDHWRLLTAARAVENQMYVIACNAVGTNRGTPMAGASRVIDPWGEVVVEAGADEGFTYADIEPDLPSQTRRAFPAVTNRRWGQAARS